MRGLIFAISIAALGLALPGVALAQPTEPNTGRWYMVPVAPGGGTNPPPMTAVGAGTAGTPAGGVASVQGVAGGTPVPVSGAFFQATQPVSGAVSTTPGTRTLVPLDVAAVTTGGTAVTAIAAGHRTAGGVLQNPPGATINLCINEVSGTASGTTSAGSTICILPGQSYALAPSPNAVSVITSDSAHPFAGYGLQ
jgi:hypothetical protein